MGGYKDTRCDLENPSFDIVVFNNVSYGGGKTRICGNIANFCNAPLVSGWNYACGGGQADRMSDRISSMKINFVASGGTVRFYQDTNYGIERLQIRPTSSDISNLAGNSDVFSSARWVSN